MKGIKGSDSVNKKLNTISPQSRTFKIYSGRYGKDERTSALGYLTKFEETQVASSGNLKSSNNFTDFSNCFGESLLAKEQCGCHKSVR